MVLVPKWLRDWIERLMPQQQHQSSGPGAVHVGNVGGNIHNITQVHHHFYPAQPQAPEVGRSRVAPFAAEMPRAESAPPTVTLSPEQHKLAVSQILKARGLLRDRELAGFKRYMEREFQTHLVKAVPHAELHRVQSYLDTTIRNREKTQ